MRITLFAATVLFLLPLTAMGQDAPRAEVFGGFSYLRTESDENLYGWNASVAGNLNNWFGLVADFSGHYDSRSSRSTIVFPGFPTTGFTFDSSQNIHTFMVGPRISYRKHERITPFGHLLVGAARRHDKSVIDSGVIGRSSFSDNRTTFVAAIGGGLDVNLSKSFALRVIQADYVLTHFFSTPQNNARVSVGLVYRFGGK